MKSASIDTHSTFQNLVQYEYILLDWNNQDEWPSQFYLNHSMAWQNDVPQLQRHLLMTHFLFMLLFHPSIPFRI